jgi:hypothetical protein
VCRVHVRVEDVMERGCTVLHAGLAVDQGIDHFIVLAAVFVI